MMPRRLIPYYRRLNGTKLILVCLLSGLAIPSVLWYRSHVTAQADRRVCVKIDRLDTALLAIVRRQPAPKPGDYGYAYWRAHHNREPNGAPGGPPAAGIIAALEKAACDPSNIAKAP